MNANGTGIKKQRRLIGTVLAAIFAAATVLMIIFALYLRIELNRQNDVNVSLSRELSAVSDENRHLRVEYERTKDPSRLEKYARERLGMQTPTRDQIRISDFAA